MRPPSLRALIGIGFPLLIAAGVAAWAMNEPPENKLPPVVGDPALTQPEPQADEERRIAAIWPAGLDQLVGRYVFAQVASPGGLWETYRPLQGPRQRRQVSINEIPAALRDQLLKAEIIISDLKAPRTREASERESPSKRGLLRFYDESAVGHLVLRNLPGIGGDETLANYEGPVTFSLLYRGHSNPSVSGWQYARDREEQTWGVAALSYASLQASTSAMDPNNAAEAEDLSVIVNARILPSGREIFAYVSWQGEAADGHRSITGSVRLLRQAPEPAQKQ